jgi:hypothetical protein
VSEPPARYESAVEKAIRLAQERGDFDNLPGKGKPLAGLDGPDDDLWWVRDYLRREGLSAEDLLPESLQLRRQLDRLDGSVAELRSEPAVREHVAELNRQIVRARRVPSGPPVLLPTANADEVVARWRAARAGPAAPRPAESEPAESEPAESEPAASAPVRAGSWWRRVLRRG